MTTQDTVQRSLEDALQPHIDRGEVLGLAWFGIVLLLMTTGIETDIAAVRRRGRATLTTSVGSLVVPFAAGIALGWWLPDAFAGDGTSRWTFAVFMGIALAISHVLALGTARSSANPRGSAQEADQGDCCARGR